MHLEDAKKLFPKLETLRMEEARSYEIGDRYYRNKTDILKPDKKFDKKEAEDPLRQADNRVPSNFHQLLVDQKAGYVASIPPVIDLGRGNETVSKRVFNVLGDKFDRLFHRLVIDASNAGVAWIHVWKSEANQSFDYAVVPSSQITPIFNNAIERKLLAVRRTYDGIEDDGKQYIYDEYWTDKEVSYFKREQGAGYDTLSMHNRITTVVDQFTNETTIGNVASHDFGQVPFIQFGNNAIFASDLDKYKSLIDIYDRTFNGFANDLEDVQQVILVLTGYEGEELSHFRQMLKKQKAIKLDGDKDTKTGVDKLTIDIPVDARNSFLDRVSEQIFIMGQGVNPQKVELGNNSGVAIKMLFSQLELKAAALETEFREGIAQLVRFLLTSIGEDANKYIIQQTWTRTSISNELEQADILARLADITSRETLAKNNPLVEDWQEELKLLETISDRFESETDFEIDTESDKNIEKS